MQSTMRATFCRLLFFVLTNSITEMECSVNRLEKLKIKRQYLIEEMTIVGQGLERSRNAKNKINSELLLDHLDRFLWPKIVDTSTAIFDNLAGDDELDHESRYQEELRRDVAKIRYKARARHCKSPDETFYRPWRRCLIFQGRKVANPCPANQQLYDGPDNFAICDCKKHVNYTMVYSDQTKQCYPLYTRGPCNKGQWWIVEDRIPECQPTPKGCPADGRHVYWTADLRQKSRRCWRLKSRGPCPENQLLAFDESNNSIECQTLLLSLSSIAIAPRRHRSPLRRATAWCPRGSQRERNYKCEGSF